MIDPAVTAMLAPGGELYGQDNILPPLELPDKDARYYAMRRLGDFIAALTFNRTGDMGKPRIQFRIPRESIHHYNPDDDTELTPPAIGVVPGNGFTDTYWLGPADVCEGTEGMFGPNTGLLYQGEYVEEFSLEIFAAKEAERRAIVAGLKTILRLGESSSALKLTLPDYFGLTAVFELGTNQYVEDPDTIRNRRRAFIVLTLRVPEVTVVTAPTFKPSVVADVGVDVDVNDC